MGANIPWPGQFAPPPPPGMKTPWPGQLAPHTWKLGNLRSEKLFNHFKLKILMHRHLNGYSTCFYLFFTLQDWGQNTVVNKFPPKLRKSCKQNQSSECYFYFLKTFSHLTGHLNISIAFYFLSFFRSAVVGGKIPWPGQLAPRIEDNLTWAACPPPAPPTPGNLANSDLKSYLIILNLKF